MTGTDERGEAVTAYKQYVELALRLDNLRSNPEGSTAEDEELLLRQMGRLWPRVSDIIVLGSDEGME